MPDSSYIPTQLTKTVARRLQIFRGTLNMTLEQASELFGLSPFTLNTLETCKRSPTLDTVGKLAVGMGVSVEKLISAGDAGDVKSEESGKTEFHVTLFEMMELLNAQGDRVKKAFKLGRKM